MPELNNGKLLIMGGEIRGGIPTTSTELLDSDKRVSVAGPSLLETHIRARATRLKTGEVVLLGGSARISAVSGRGDFSLNRQGKSKGVRAGGRL